MAHAIANQGRAHPVPPHPLPTPGPGRGWETHRGTRLRGEWNGFGRAHPLKQEKRGPNFTLYCLIQTLMVIVL